MFFPVLLCVSLAAGWAGGRVQSSPADVSVVVRGEADASLDRQTAVDRAVASALRIAVEQVAGVYVASESEVREFSLLEDRILTRSSGYVTSYRILEQNIRDGRVIVLVEASVDSGALASKLAAIGLLRSALGSPVLAFRQKRSDVGGALTRSLVQDWAQTNGFEVSTRPSTADIVFELETTTEAMPAQAGFQTGVAFVEVRAVDSEGFLLGAGTAEMTRAGASPETARRAALRGAVDKALAEGIDDLLMAWRSRVYERESISLLADGIVSFDDVLLLRDELALAIPGTLQVSLGDLDITKGTAKLRWFGRATPTDLAAAIQQHPFGALVVTVSSLESRKLGLLVQRRRSGGMVPKPFSW